ncbi:MAG TPA: circadian clock protein KaiC, partial [Bacteroidetes bacterium]|nr:circadian clock protein KaiC [Bacteroidota bacterium]
LFAMEFIYKGAVEFGEPVVFVAFEETEEELKKNVTALGWNLDKLIGEKKLIIEHIRINPSEIVETGEYSLDGLLLRLKAAIDEIGAKRLAIDTIEVLFSSYSNSFILRAEIQRLFRFLKENKVTAVITGEMGDGRLTRHGLEEYVSDCVVSLDHSVANGIATRRLRVVKYRGSRHKTNEFPFFIEENGFSLMPVTDLEMDYEAPHEKISTGIPRLDAMFGGEGCYRGSSILISGTAGTGKSTLAVTFADVSCRRQEPCIYISFEESADQIIRNMRSVGFDLKKHIDNGLLKFYSTRPTLMGLEEHLFMIQSQIDKFNPKMVIVDPISNLVSISSQLEVKWMFTRLIDFIKRKQITTIMTDLTEQDSYFRENSTVGISSLIDTWIFLRDIESGGERNRGLYILKARGLNHSNQIREFHITSKGIKFLDVYTGPGGVLTGSARLTQMVNDKLAELKRKYEVKNKQLQLELMRKQMESRIAEIRAEYEAKEAELKRLIEQDELKQKILEDA